MAKLQYKRSINVLWYIYDAVMWKKIALLTKNSFFIALVLGIFFMLFHVGDFQTYWKLPTVSGWDGASHEAIGQYYSEHIFPKTSGWINNWYGGMPFPEFYPPLFYIVLALLQRIFFFVPYLLIFKSVVTVLTISIPGIIAYISKRFSGGNMWASWMGGIITCISMSMVNTLASNGMTFDSIFLSGLVTELMGIAGFLIWIFLFIKEESSVSSVPYSIIFLSIVLLSNVHLAIVTFFIYCGFFIFNIVENVVKKKQNFFSDIARFLLRGAIPLLIVSFWYLPVILHYHYVVTVSIFISSAGQIISAYFLFFIFTIITFIVSYRRKNREIFLISIASISIFVPVVCRFDLLFPMLPMHIDRWIAVYGFLATIGAAYSIGVLIKSLPKNWMRIGIFIFLAVLFSYVTWTNSVGIDENIFYHNYYKDNIPAISAYLSKIGGLTSVEVNDDEPVHCTLNAVLGSTNVHTTFVVFRESSISSLFMIPFTNSLSLKVEKWGIKSFLIDNNDFLNENIRLHLDQAQILGVSNFLIRSKKIQDELISDKRIELVKDFGNWKLYSFKNIQHQQGAKILPFKPTLLFSQVTFKTRAIDSYDYVRFNEELFYEAKKDVVLAESNTPLIDKEDNLDSFGSVIISQYSYNNIQQAFERLEVYSRNHPLILIEDNDPLFKQLSSLDASHHIFIFKKEHASGIDPDPLRSQMKTIFTVLEKYESSSSIPTDFAISNVTKDQNNINIQFSGNISAPVPILISTSYFPSWKRSENSELYLASPTYMLTFASTDVNIKFKDTNIYGISLSILGLFLLVYLLYPILSTRTVSR